MMMSVLEYTISIVVNKQIIKVSYRFRILVISEVSGVTGHFTLNGYDLAMMYTHFDLSNFPNFWLR